MESMESNKKINDNKSSKKMSLSSEFFYNHNFVMLIIDPKTEFIVDVNNKAVEYYGCSKEEILKLKIQDVNVLNNQEVYNEMHKTQKERKKFFNFRCELSDGDIREVEVYSTSIVVEEHEYIRYLILDVTKNRIENASLNQLFLKTSMATLILDNNDKIINCNNSFLELFKFDKENIIGKESKYIIANNIKLPNDVDDIIAKVNQGFLITKEGKSMRSDGIILDLNITSFPLLNCGEQIGKVVTFSDISEKIKKQNELKLFEKAMSNNNEGMTITDKDGNIEWVNNAFLKITGYSREEIIGQNPRILKSGIHDKIFYKNMWDSILNEGNWKGEIYNKNKRGDVYPEFLNISAIRDEHNGISNFIAIFRDITKEKNNEREIWQLVHKDGLTGTYNRVFFNNKLKEQLNKDNKKIAVFFIDIDDFKNINDTLGHSYGDKVLIELANRMIKNLDGKGIIARMGGDEFTILINDYKDKENLKAIGNRILESTIEPLKIDNKEIFINASIGISFYQDSEFNIDTLIKNADIAMYKAKENKGDNLNRIMFYDSYMEESIAEEFFLSNQLNNCLERKELYLVYQPIVDIYTNKIIGVEALARWQHPQFGIIPPDKFIPLAEKTGVINKIGTWVLKTACKQNKQWQLDGHEPITISVNVSVIQLKQENFIQILKDILIETQLQSKYLELEITESISMENLKYISKVIGEIQEIGISIAIDDFGTGYSSLSQLNSMNISKLKIDKSFLDDIDREKNSKSIIVAIIAIAKNLDIKVVAEGIETVEQLVYLKDVNCDFGQGYYFSKPVESKVLRENILNGNKNIV